MLPHMMLPLLVLFLGQPTTRSAHVVEYPKLNTFTVGGEVTELLSSVVTVSAQLSPVYNPNAGDGEPAAPPPSVVEATPVVAVGAPPSSGVALSSGFATKTVYGFLDFTTTVGDTVMVFTPQSESAKSKPSKSRIASQSTRTSVSSRTSQARPPSNAPPVSPFALSPTPTLPRLKATAAPSTHLPKPSTFPSSTLESSFFDPHTTLAIEDLFSVAPKMEVVEAVFAIPGDEYQYEQLPEEEEEEEKLIKESNAFKRHSPFRRPQETSDTTGARRRLDLNFFANRKKSDVPRRSFGGSTIVPITVEGTGRLEQKTKVIPQLPQSPVFITTPSEVIVSATQGFASLSIIGPFTTAVNNELGQVIEHYDFLSSAPTLDVQESYDVFEVEPTAHEDLRSASLVENDASFPTGLVTKIGGTIISDGLTTVHETSVLGTYIEGQYAQVLLSTSRIFQTSVSLKSNVRSSFPSLDYETVKSVIKGSATQFITPEPTSALPLESLFSAPTGRSRDSRRSDDDATIQSRMRSALTKRRGAQDSVSRSRPQPVHDPYVDEEEDQDLQRAGSNLRPSYRFQQSKTVKTPVASTIYAQSPKPTTFRPRYKASATRRQSGGRTSTFRPTPSSSKRQGRPTNRWRLGTTPRPKVNVRRPLSPPDAYEKEQTVEESHTEPVIQPTPEKPDAIEETLRIVTSTLADGPTDAYFEVATIRSLHTFRVGTTKNTRFVTFTKTISHNIPTTPEPTTPEPTLTQDDLYETPLFENILDDGPRDVSTLPPVDIGSNDISAVLETVTETFSTTEIIKKTSVLPVLQNGDTFYHTLTQTYHITRVVTALKTMPPYEAFSFIPENSLNEFNGQLLAEGTENDEALLPGEVEYDENGEIVERKSETRVRPPPGFSLQDPNLAELAGGEFNPDVFEKQLHPQLAAALEQRQQQPQQQPQQESSAPPQLAPGQLPAPLGPALPTPGLTPEQLQQLAYLRLMNPFLFGGLPSVQPQTTITSSPVTITTDLTTTSTRVFRVILNARPIMTTISSVEVVHTTLTTYSTTTITVTPTVSPFSFPFAPSPFQVG
ncbi:uncharacterized protein [Procambarus clarkii]|uniref:uncharacterized protein isoform X1 n=1 Tax=Procambarus clarkii TaxID=6728 RepID=UPI003742DC0A